MKEIFVKYIILCFLAVFLLDSSYAQIIKGDMGSVSGMGTGMGGVISAPITPGGATFKPLGADMKPMEQKIEHKAPKIEDCFSLTDGRKEVGALDVDSLNNEKSRKFMLEMMSMYDAAGRAEAKKYYGDINVKSVTVYDNCTRVVLEANNFINAQWFLVSKASVIIDHDTRKPYFIRDVERSIVLNESFALNMTRSSYQQICLVFPKLDSWVDYIDLICPMPDKSEIEYMNASGGHEELVKQSEKENNNK